MITYYLVVKRGEGLALKYTRVAIRTFGNQAPLKILKKALQEKNFPVDVRVVRAREAFAPHPPEFSEVLFSDKDKDNDNVYFYPEEDAVGRATR